MPLSCYVRAGFSSSAFTSFNTSGINTDNEIASRSFGLPFPGRIIRLAAYFAGNAATVTARVVAWDATSFALVAKSAQFTAAAGTAATSGQALHNQPSDLLGAVIGGVTVVVGWWRAAGGTAAWSVLTGGSFEKRAELGADAAGFVGNTACGAPYTCGDIEAFCDVVGGDPRTLEYGFPAFRRKR